MKHFLLFTLLLSFFFLVSCSTSATKDDILISQNLQEEKEFQILQLLSDQSGLWNLTIHNDSAQTAEIIVDHYHFGKKQDSLIQLSSNLDELKTSNEFFLLLAEQVYDGESKWTLAIANENNTIAAESSAPNMDQFLNRSYASPRLPLTANIGEEIILASMTFTDGEESLAWIRDLEDELDPKELESYDHTYGGALYNNKDKENYNHDNL